MGKFGVHCQEHVTANGTIYPAIGLVAAAGERGGDLGREAEEMEIIEIIAMIAQKVIM